LKLNLNTPNYIAGTYFDTKLSMFGLAPSVTEEGAEGPRRAPQLSAGSRRRGAETHTQTHVQTHTHRHTHTDTHTQTHTQTHTHTDNYLHIHWNDRIDSWNLENLGDSANSTHLSVAPAVNMKLSPSKLSPVNPVKLQPFLTPRRSASFLY